MANGVSRKGIVVAVFAGAAVLAGLILFQLRPASPLEIGFVGGISGKIADLGIDCRRGTEIAVERTNRVGGINGRPVKLIALDDAQDENKAREAVQTLLTRNLPAIIGHTTSAMTMATLPLVNASSTLLVSPTSSTPLLRDIDDNLIRSCAVSTDAANLMARYLREEKKVSSVGIIYDLANKAYTEMWYKAFSESFRELGGSLAEPLTFSSGPDIALLPLIERMRQQPIESLVIVANSVDAALLCQQVRKSGWQIPLALADWAATEQLISLGGKAVEGAVISQYFNRKSTAPDYLDFKREFARAYKSEPGFGALHAYNATMMVLRSLAEKQDGETLKRTILRISLFKGLQDDIVINRFGDSNHPTYMGVIENGTFRIFEEYR